MRSGYFPIHGKGRFCGIRLDNAFERADAIFWHVSRSLDVQVHAGRRAKLITERERHDPIAKMAVGVAANFILGILDVE